MFFCLLLLLWGSMKPSSSAATSWISFSRNGEICATVPSSTGNANVPALQLEPTSVHDNCQKSFLSGQLWFMALCVHLGFESKNQAQLWFHCTCFAYDAQTRLPCSSIHDSTNQKLVQHRWIILWHQVCSSWIDWFLALERFTLEWVLQICCWSDSDVDAHESSPLMCLIATVSWIVASWWCVKVLGKCWRICKLFTQVLKPNSNMKVLRLWNKLFVISCFIGLFLDPLFFLTISISPVYFFSW